MTPPQNPERETPNVQSFERGLAVIRAFSRDTPEMTLTEVAQATGLTRAGARRFLLTLVDMCYATTDGRKFRLSPKILELGYSYLSSLGLPEIAQPFLRNMVERTGESSSMSVLDGDDIVYVARVPTSQIMTIGITVGTRFPAYATSMGRVLLAGLDDEELGRRLRRIKLQPYTKRTVSSVDELYNELLTVRKQGYSLVDQELEDGLRSIAAPVRNRAGCTVAAVNVSSHAARMSKERARKEFLPPLLEAVRDIGACIT